MAKNDKGAEKTNVLRLLDQAGISDVNVISYNGTTML